MSGTDLAYAPRKWIPKPAAGPASLVGPAIPLCDVRVWCAMSGTHIAYASLSPYARPAATSGTDRVYDATCVLCDVRYSPIVCCYAKCGTNRAYGAMRCAGEMSPMVDDKLASRSHPPYPSSHPPYPLSRPPYPQSRPPHPQSRATLSSRPPIRFPLCASPCRAPLSAQPRCRLYCLRLCYALSGTDLAHTTESNPRRRLLRTTLYQDWVFLRLIRAARFTTRRGQLPPVLSAALGFAPITGQHWPRVWCYRPVCVRYAMSGTDLAYGAISAAQACMVL
eukprot:373055-Rhodomonas_salina.1